MISLLIYLNHPELIIWHTHKMTLWQYTAHNVTELCKRVHLCYIITHCSVSDFTDICPRVDGSHVLPEWQTDPCVRWPQMTDREDIQAAGRKKFLRSRSKMWDGIDHVGTCHPLCLYKMADKQIGSSLLLTDTLWKPRPLSSTLH